MRSLLIGLMVAAVPAPALALTFSGVAAPDAFGFASFDVPLPIYRSGILDIRVQVAADPSAERGTSVITRTNVTFFDFFDPFTGEPMGGNDTQVETFAYFQDIFAPATASYETSFLVQRRIPYVVRVPGAPFPSETGFSESLVSVFGEFSAGAPLAWRITLGGTAAVPEPGAWVLLVVGFGAVGSALRRRKATAVTALPADV